MANLLSQELNLGNLLLKIMNTTKVLLSAERCTLFMYDEKTKELWARATGGTEAGDIRFPSHLGIAGSVFTTGETINIPDAYADPRFNPAVDKKTGFRTRSILCMPVKNKDGQIIGVSQVLNKQGGPFTEIDERRLGAFSAEASIALDNAKLFEDILNMKNYNESMLESMSNGVISLDAERTIVKCNGAALKILKRKDPHTLIGTSVVDLFSETNPWILTSVDKVMETMKVDLTMDTDLKLHDGDVVSVNLTVVPLTSIHQDMIGSLLILEDITKEKRLKGTMSRYMAKEVVDKLLERGETMLGGRTQEATVLFSDIRKFTTISEGMASKELVQVLNNYFSIMVDIIFKYQGILDKYIGDAIMAVFGVPFSSGDDPDRAVKTALEMLEALEEFNQKYRAEGQEPFKIGIGINTNEILAGNIGSIKRMDYTVIGDGVNLADRLQSANKIYGTHILVSEFTYKKLKGAYVSRELDLATVKGKSKPVGVYQIFGEQERTSFPHFEEVLELFHKGVQSYRNQDWQKGIACFTRILRELNANDVSSRLYLDRCRYLSKHPPAPDWNHAWTLMTK
jgi:adenylate cyclase